MRPTPTEFRTSALTVAYLYEQVAKMIGADPHEYVHDRIKHARGNRLKEASFTKDDMLSVTYTACAIFVDAYDSHMEQV